MTPRPDADVTRRTLSSDEADSNDGAVGGPAAPASNAITPIRSPATSTSPGSKVKLKLKRRSDEFKAAAALQEPGLFDDDDDGLGLLGSPEPKKPAAIANPRAAAASVRAGSTGFAASNSNSNDAAAATTMSGGRRRGGRAGVSRFAGESIAASSPAAVGDALPWEARTGTPKSTARTTNTAAAAATLTSANATPASQHQPHSSRTTGTPGGGGGRRGSAGLSPTAAAAASSPIAAGSGGISAAERVNRAAHLKLKEENETLVAQLKATREVAEQSAKKQVHPYPHGVSATPAWFVACVACVEV